MIRPIDPARLLLRALGRSAAEAACAAALSVEGEAPWASATFVGAQYRIRVAGRALGSWLHTLPEAELPVRGHVVASCDVERQPGGAMLTVLLLETH